MTICTRFTGRRTLRCCPCLSRLPASPAEGRQGVRLNFGKWKGTATKMNLRYDPADNQAFWDAVRRLPGFPHGDEIPLRWMVIAEDGLERLPGILRQLDPSGASPVLVVMDPTPMRRGADDLKPLVLSRLRLAGWEARPLVLQPDASGQVHTDMLQIGAVQGRLQPGCIALALGSGVVTDVTKHACYLYHQAGGPPLPFAVYQTANSVSAFTSDMAPVFVDGVKRTLPSRYADALVCDLPTLQDAPLEMTLAGVGDLLAAYVSLPDWYLAYRLGMDPSYNELPAALLGPLDEILAHNAAAFHDRTPAGMALLAKLISLGGLAMSLAHATTPMSGYEHVLSHVLDMFSEVEGLPLAPHGLQVALASVLGAGMYQAFLRDFRPEAVQIETCYPPEPAMQAQIEAAFFTIDPSGRAGRECWSDYRQKLERWSGQREALQDCLAGWPALRLRLEQMTTSPQRLQAILRAIQAPLRFADLNPPASPAQVHFAYLNAPLMRKRLTLGDLLIFFGWDREALWQECWPLCS